ncbi:hypothetical protein K438DRAFT_1761621 [Mycena galopus ATCC 62051]|nr:hypothetical protein K438DRAFT_1761621 [Mycena galopus ATCC 62051]
MLVLETPVAHWEPRTDKTSPPSLILYPGTENFYLQIIATFTVQELKMRRAENAQAARFSRFAVEQACEHGAWECDVVVWWLNGIHTRLSTSRASDESHENVTNIGPVSHQHNSSVRLQPENLPNLRRSHTDTGMPFLSAKLIQCAMYGVQAEVSERVLAYASTITQNTVKSVERKTCVWGAGGRGKEGDISAPVRSQITATSGSHESGETRPKHRFESQLLRSGPSLSSLLQLLNVL